ncbi:hypothetical protein SKAU_G00061820 [Synaphobranchus kaupii]|uniref:Gypsy retrotransposon integrase-like protein 1 n=1 Tax=Synaphobranchus kaupii TaxID=118154 RepID=A0A9Q1JAV0_SYNKA|nr:hypothetical protein SKAU_G00061820 [Synaphobranchus kaupii]
MWSDSWTAHRELLSYVLTRLSVAGAKISLDKGQWCKRAVNYLGFQVGQEGIRPQLNRTLSLQILPAPTTLKQLRSFLGICNFSCHFVADYAKIAQPLTRLLKKDTPWHWGQEQDVAMRTLKDSILAAPALAFPDKTKPFILETAFTPFNISAVLKQQQDQQKSVKLREGKVNNARIANWILAMEGLSLQVKYAKSKNNAVAQGLAALHDCASLPHQPSEERPPTDLPGLANHRSFSDVLCPTFPKVYVDGSAHRKTGTLGAGVGLVWTNCDLPPQKFKLGPKSSQYAELAGTLIALTQAAEHNYEHLVICTDSDCTVRSFIDYLPHWLANDMKKSDGHSKLDGPDKAGNDRANALAKEGVSTGQPWEFGNPASQFSQPTDNSSVTIGTSELRNTQREADTPLFPQPPAQVDVVTRSCAKAPDPHNPSNSNRITLITPEAHNDLVQAQEKDQALTHLIRILQDTTSVADSGDLINDAYLMQHAHDEPCGGHRGEQSTISMLCQVAYWPKMWTDVKDYVNSCLTCCKFQPVLPRHRAPLQSTPTTQPWSHIQIDWIGPITRSSRGNQYALTVTDMFTKWVVSPCTTGHRRVHSRPPHESCLHSLGSATECEF